VAATTKVLRPNPGIGVLLGAGLPGQGHVSARPGATERQRVVGVLANQAVIRSWAVDVPAFG